jgi:hypothetical protein
MDRCYLEHPGLLAPDEESEDQKPIAIIGDQRERAVLDEFRSSTPNLVEISKDDPDVAQTMTLAAINSKAPIIYQAALENFPFAGFADFLAFCPAQSCSRRF